MKLFAENLLVIIREKKTSLFIALPFFLILLAIAAYAAVFTEPQSQKKPIPTPTIAPIDQPEPTDEIPLTPEPTLDPETESVLQELDKGQVQHAEEQAAIQRNYPWFNQLPLDELDYFVYFDAEIKSFVGLLYPQTSSSTPINLQVEQMKTTITQELDAMNIPWQSYPFNWNVIPE